MATQHWSLSHKLHSLRWRLPLSYAAVVLLTVLILGATLLFALDRYYAVREEAYLRDTAHAMDRFIVAILEDEASVQEGFIQDSLAIMSFFSRSEIRIYDLADNIIAESSSATGHDFALSVDMSEADFTDAVNFATGTGEVAPQRFPIQIERLNVDGSADEPGRPPNSLRMWAFDAPFGYMLSDEDMIRKISRRSDQQITMPLIGYDGAQIATLELYDGPAFGTEVINSVLRQLNLAAILVIPLSVFIGWGISRSISKPVLTLTDATQQMAGGKLSTRVTMQRRDEIGMLATTFNAMADQIEQTIRTLEQFVADAAHEIKTPLTSIRTNLELAAGGITNENSLSDLALAQKELQRLEKLTNSLLTLARLEADNGEAASEPVDISGLIRQVHENYASRAEQAGITMMVTTPKSPVMVEGNPQHIIRLLENLVDNAVKFTPEDGTVSIALTNQDARTARLIIADTGIGIPPNDLPKLFSRFHRGRNTANYPGSGLGLVIAQTIAEDHGGSISVESDPGGTCFTVDLPYKTVQEPAS